MKGIDLLIDQLKKARIINKNNYKYIITPLCEQEPPLDPSIIEESAEKLIKMINLDGVNKILTAETMGVPIATAISMKTGIPLIIATKREKQTKCDIKIECVCGYEKVPLHFNDINPGDKVLIVDDLISTGGTVIAMAEAIKNLGAVVSDICVIADKVMIGGSERLKSMGYNPKAIIEIDVNNNNKCTVKRL